jgi:hypothetical protein
MSYVTIVRIEKYVYKTGYWLDDREFGVRFHVQERDSFLLRDVHTVSGSHPVSYPVGIWVISPGVKRQGREADHSPPSSTEGKNVGAILPSPIYFYGAVFNYSRQGVTLPYIPTSQRTVKSVIVVQENNDYLSL